MNEKLKNMHKKWHKDKKIKSYYKTKLVKHAEEDQNPEKKELQ